MSRSQRVLPGRPSLEQLRNQAKDLLRAARDGNADALARLGPTPGKRIALADAQLALAREYGFASWPKLVRHVEELLGRGFVLQPLIRPVEMTDDDVYAMFVAARAGDLAAVKRLVAKTPTLATVEYNYTPPIHFAVREGHRDVAEFLLANGADPAYRSYPFQESLLGFAEDRGHEDLAALLRTTLARRFELAAGTDAIIEAAKRGDLAAVDRELKQNPAIATASNETGDTPLHAAAKHGRLAVVQRLLAAGANPDAIRGDGWRPIHCALMTEWRAKVSRETELAIARMLLGAGAGYTVFVAEWMGDRAFVRDSVRRDPALANFEDTCHHRVLSAAVRQHDPETVRLLLDSGADPTLPEEGAPRGGALWPAVNDRQTEIVEMLLKHGADPNGMVESSGTPMMQAMARKFDDMVALLAKFGGTKPEPSERDEVQRLVEAGELHEAEKILRRNLHWILDDAAGWGDGVMAGPANEGRNDVLAMLIRLGAKVPPVSKWAPYYYFKHEATAKFLLEHGMDANHMNWHRFTLLHHMAADGGARQGDDAARSWRRDRRDR